MAEVQDIIEFKKGDKNVKACFRVGEHTVPAALITRFVGAMKGKPDNIIRREFTTILNEKRPKGLSYDNILDVLENAKIDYLDAFNYMKGYTPNKGESKSNESREVKAVAKFLGSKKAKGTIEERIDAFMKKVNEPEFRVKVIEIINSSKIEK